MPTHEALQSNHLYHQAWSQFAHASRSGEVIENQGILAVTAGVAWPATNLAFLQSPVSSFAELADRIGVAKRFFADRYPWLFVAFDEWVGPDIDAHAVFASQNLRFVQESIGMVADGLSPVARQLPNLRFHLADDTQTLYEMASINAESYGMPLALVQEAVESGPHWASPAMTYIGYMDNEPVATAMTSPIGEVLFVGWVATRPARQRRGCAEAIMRHALEQQRAKVGQMRSGLHATPAGLPLYERIGYRPVARFELYLGGSLPKT